MKKILIVIVAFFFFNIANAQISGYMGNRFSFIYNWGVSFPHITNLSDQGTEILPAINHGFNVEYIYSNIAAVGVRYKLGMNSGKNTLSSIDNSGSKRTDHTQLTNFDERYKFYSHSYGAYVKFYRRNSLAPIGLYTLIGLNFQQLILKDMIRPNYIDQSIITKQNYVQYDLCFNLGMGRNWIIADRMLLGFQVEASLPWASIANAIGVSPIDGDELVNNSEYNGYNSSAILSRYNLTSEILRLSLNIGFLAF